jgi:DNA-binding GntR family transcriptional regulator
MRQHEAITTMLEAGELRAAADAVEAHWVSNIEPLFEAITQVS